MTAHPKYYSLVGLVAPPDRKAVYMGYAFLYGVFGSLLGSNLGSFLYSAILKPVIGTPQAEGRARLFWLLFAVLDVVAAAGLVLFSRSFGRDTPDARRRARPLMNGIYVLILALGAAFLCVAFAAATTARATAGGSLFFLVLSNRTAIQALIFLALGGGGLLMNNRQR
jgi:hypothetical protein